MELPFEILIALFANMIALSVIGVLKQIPLMMFIGGALFTFILIPVDSIPALGDTMTCVSTLPDTTTCEDDSYILDVWVKIVLLIFGSLFMLGGALIWKAMEE